MEAYGVLFARVIMLLQDRYIELQTYNKCCKVATLTIKHTQQKVQRTFTIRKTCVLVNVCFYKTPVLRTLLDVRKTCVNERTLNMRYSIYTFTMR